MDVQISSLSYFLFMLLVAKAKSHFFFIFLDKEIAALKSSISIHYKNTKIQKSHTFDIKIQK